MSAIRSRLRYWIVSALLVEAYFVAGRLSLLLAYQHPSASPVWPPAGLAFAILLLLGRRYWPVVFVGAYLVNVTTDGHYVASAVIATGNAFEALLGAELARRFAGGRKAFETVRGIAVFSLCAALLSPVVSATFGIGALSLNDSIPAGELGTVWFTWWLGDAVGLLVAAPLVVTWTTSVHKRCGFAEAGEALALLLFLAFVSWLVFATVRMPVSYLCLLPVVWCGLRFAPRDTALCVAIVSAVSVAATVVGWGPFVSSRGPNFSLLYLEAFLGVASFVGMTLSAAMLERRVAMRSLEEAIAERTAELTAALEKDRANAERLSHVVNHMTVATIAVDERLKVLHMNDHFRSLFGIRGEGKESLTDVFGDIRTSFRDPHATIDGLLEMLAARRKTVDLKLTLKNDAHVYCDYIPITVGGLHRGHLFICRESQDIFARS